MNNLKRDVIIEGDCRDGIAGLATASVNCIVTSPPYYRLRDYGMIGQMGLEETPEEFVASMVSVFRDARRVLRDDGTLWLNIGDSYAGNGEAYGDAKSSLQGPKQSGVQGAKRKSKSGDGLKSKDLIGIPWMLAFALRADGWYLRQDIIWHKPNPMPESVTDRCTKSHEYIFLLSKSPKYYYDQAAIMQEMAKSSISRLNQDVESQAGSDRVPGKTNGRMKAVGTRFGGNKYGDDESAFSKTHSGNLYIPNGKANKRSVWTVATRPFKEAHFATFPPELIIDCIKAGCPEGGLVLDPFMGAGTTALVAKKLLRHYIGFELNPAYIEIANRRLRDNLGLFA